MTDKFEIKETGTDFWGRKTYEVRKKSSSDGSALGYLFFIMIGLVIFTLPSGIIALILYIPLKLTLLNNKKIENLQSKKEKLAWGTIFIGIISTIYFYYTYLDLTYMIGYLLITFVLGVLSYYILYKIVTWNVASEINNNENEKKKSTKNELIKLLIGEKGLKFYKKINSPTK